MIIDGKEIANAVTQELKTTIIKFGLKPKLAIVLVGDHSASQIYVNQKVKKGAEIGVSVEVFKFRQTSSQQEVEAAIARLNIDPSVQGIIVQLPLPEGFSKDKLINLVTPQKDVDGLVPDSPFEPATALGIMELLKRSSVKITNKTVVVMGASALVGQPVARLLRAAGGLVQVVDVNTPNPEGFIKKAAILVVAIGEPHYVKKDMVKDGVVVIDVGTNRTELGLVGDVDFENVQAVASLITPVPGGVGPMTVAMLLGNVVKAAQ